MRLIIKKGLLFFVLLLLFGCTDWNKKAVGNLNEIIVCTDAVIWEETEDLLRDIIEKELITPQNEKIFNLIKIEPLNFSNYNNHRHIILLGTLDSNGKFPEYIEAVLDADMKNAVIDGKYYYVIKKDEFVRNQLLMVLAAADLSVLKEKISENRAFIFNQFDNIIDKNVEQSMFGRKENTKLEKKLYETYGWTMRMQPDMVVAKEDKDFVWFRRFNPDRMISVYWKDSADGSELDEEWAMEKREFIGKEYLDKMETVHDFTNMENINFQGRNAIKIEGLWEKKDFGGFFRSYVFFDRNTKRIYFIDLATFVPDKEKEPFIRQLDIIAHTFSTTPLKPFKKKLLR